MTSHSFAEPHTIAVLDLETTLDPAAAGAAGFKGGTLPSALQKITTACILAASERLDGTWCDFRLDTYADPLDEFDILMQLDGRLAELHRLDAVISTYNGRRHDLAVIRRRAARHWMFGLPGIAGAAAMRHVDVMIRQTLGRRDAPPSLRHACAGLGIGIFDPRTTGTGAAAPAVRKCQTDVVATFLLTLYEIATDRGSPAPLFAGWEALSGHLAGLRPRALHLEHFRDHFILRTARKVRAENGLGDVETN